MLSFSLDWKTFFYRVPPETACMHIACVTGLIKHFCLKQLSVAIRLKQSKNAYSSFVFLLSFYLSSGKLDWGAFSCTCFDQLSGRSLYVVLM